MIKTAKDCIHCHKCSESCAFLSSFGIDIGDTDRLRELAYHCFLCGRCTEVCPVGIDGRQIILDMRRERAASEERPLIEKTYKGTLGEKRKYRFKNWKHAAGSTVFFPGCNFPSLFPKTCRALEGIFARHGIGTVYDCCGKPVAELGFCEDEERIIEEIRDGLKERNIEELIVACPNCRSHFGERLGVKVSGVYEKLRELGEGREIDADVRLFVPCPDRQASVWRDEISAFIKGEITYVEGVQCCGLGGGASVCEKELASGFARSLKEQEPGRVYTYCASCTGSFARGGFTEIGHILPAILGTGEKPDTAKSYINRLISGLR